MPLHIIRQDITKIKCDAIVNTTNKEMIGYSGVDLAIHTAAGPLLDKECEKLQPLGLGCVKITKGYNLPAKYIIHTSGPIWKDGYSAESIILKSCYTESIKLAAKYGCESIAFPLISSGEYGYPKDQVLKYAVDVISKYLYYNEMTVYLCVYDKTSYEFSKDLYNDIKDYLTSGVIGSKIRLKEQRPYCHQIYSSIVRIRSPNNIKTFVLKHFDYIFFKLKSCHINKIHIIHLKNFPTILGQIQTTLG